MPSVPASLAVPAVRWLPPENPARCVKRWDSADLRLCCRHLTRNRPKPRWVFCVRVSGGDSLGSDASRRAGDGASVGAKRNGGGFLERRVKHLRETVHVLPLAIHEARRTLLSNVAFGIYIAFAFFVIVVRQIKLKKQSQYHQGSVADLVRRGQLKSNRRAIATPLMYDDPFNNPLVKVNSGSSTVQMFGKVYRMAPVTLTKEQQSIHQKRRSRAYQWKRPTVFLKEGDVIPQDVDPDMIRWIPANHPFAAACSDIDENIAKNNVYQKEGAPFRVKIEHEVLQKKLQALQNETQVNQVRVDQKKVQDDEKPIKSSGELQEQQEATSTADTNDGHATFFNCPEEFDSSDKRS